MAKMGEIAAWLGVDLTGLDVSAAGQDADITEVSATGGAARHSLVFAVDGPALGNALDSNAGVILANRRLEVAGQPRDPRILWVEDARYAFALVAQRLRGACLRGDIHPSAVVADGVSIGDGTSVGPGVVLEAGVVVGRDCTLLARVTVHQGTVLGDRVVVQAGAVLGSTGFGYARNPATGEYVLFPQQGRLVVEDDVDIGANTTIDRGALGETRIGKGTKIDNLVHIGHNCIIGRNVIIAAQTGISGSSVVEDGAILGGQVGIGEHATVGAGVILGGGAGVLSGKKMRGAGQVFWGRPARPLRQYLQDLARLKRR